MQIGAKQQTVVHSISGFTHIRHDVSSFQYLQDCATCNGALSLIGLQQCIPESWLPLTLYDGCSYSFASIQFAIDRRKFLSSGYIHDTGPDLDQSRLFPLAIGALYIEYPMQQVVIFFVRAYIFASDTFEFATIELVSAVATIASKITPSRHMVIPVRIIDGEKAQIVLNILVILTGMILGQPSFDLALYAGSSNRFYCVSNMSVLGLEV